MGKNQKEHKRKVRIRNQEIAIKRKKIEKEQKDNYNFLMDLIAKEKAAGKFGNIPPTESTDIPDLNNDKPTFLI